MESQIFQVAAQVESIRTLKDKSLKIVIETQELNPEEKTLLFELGDKAIWIAMKETPVKFDELDIKEPEVEFKNDSSPSKRLRSVLFVYYKQNYSGQKTFDEFYRDTIDKLCDLYKSKLD